jgi:hypothetical protein
MNRLWFYQDDSGHGLRKLDPNTLRYDPQQPPLAVIFWDLLNPSIEWQNNEAVKLTYPLLQYLLGEDGWKRRILKYESLVWRAVQEPPG